MEYNDDGYERGRYNPTDISIPGSMVVAEGEMERAEREMERMLEMVSRRPPPAATTNCSAPDISSPRSKLQAISPSAPQV